MRLVDLKPHWIERDSQRIAIMFLCPHCVKEGRPKPIWLSCFFIPTEHIAGEDGQYALFEQELEAMGITDQDGSDVVPCRRGFAWTRSSDDFASISIWPSLDASKCGHWHGFIKVGQIDGGI